MADTKTVDNANAHGSHEGVNYLNETSGLWSWLTTVDHKRIGVMYIYTIIAFFIVGGLFALALRLELMTAEKLFMTADVYNQVMRLLLQWLFLALLLWAFHRFLLVLTLS